MDAVQFAELETKLKDLETKLAAREAENTSLKQAGEAATAQSTQLAEQVQRMAAERQQERFGTLIRNDGARWFGESSQHLSVLGVAGPDLRRGLGRAEGVRRPAAGHRGRAPRLERVQRDRRRRRRAHRGRQRQAGSPGQGARGQGRHQLRRCALQGRGRAARPVRAA
jgi:hypothetical protein